MSEASERPSRCADLAFREELARVTALTPRERMLRALALRGALTWLARVKAPATEARPRDE